MYNWQLVQADVYDRHLSLSIQEAESRESQSFHCCTPDCRGWCIYEDEVNVFECPVCGHANCLTCKVQHEGCTCRQYQDSLRARASVDKAAKKTQKIIEVVFRWNHCYLILWFYRMAQKKVDRHAICEHNLRKPKLFFSNGFIPVECRCQK